MQEQSGNDTECSTTIDAGLEEKGLKPPIVADDQTRRGQSKGLGSTVVPTVASVEPSTEPVGEDRIEKPAKEPAEGDADDILDYLLQEWTTLYK
jgi:hypothetical protein